MSFFGIVLAMASGLLELKVSLVPILIRAAFFGHPPPYIAVLAPLYEGFSLSTGHELGGRLLKLCPAGDRIAACCRLSFGWFSDSGFAGWGGGASVALVTWVRCTALD